MTPPGLALPFMLMAIADPAIPDAEAVVVRVGDDHCVDAAGLTALVELRAGVGSVVDDGPRVVDVTFAGRAPAVEVTLTLHQEGARVGSRRLGPFTDCGAAIDAAALAVALMIDPFGPPPAPSPPPPAPPPATPATTTATTIATTTTATTLQGVDVGDWPLTVGVGGAVGGSVGFGVTPGPMALVRAHVGAGQLPLAVALGGRLDLSAPLVIDDARRLESVGGAFFIEGCGRIDRVDDVGALILDLCALGEVGGLRAVAFGFPEPLAGSATMVTAGAAVTLRVPLWEELGAFVRVGSAMPVLKARLLHTGETLWENPLLTGQVTFGLDGLSRPQGSNPRTEEGR